MNKINKDLYNSFGLVRKDIMGLQQDIVLLTQNQQEMFKMIHDLRNQISKAKSVKKVTVKKVVKKVARKKTSFIASKTGNKFHKSNCVFTKNIKPKMKVKFASKTTALNKGYKPCACVK